MWFALGKVISPCAAEVPLPVVPESSGLCVLTAVLPVPAQKTGFNQGMAIDIPEGLLSVTSEY